MRLILLGGSDSECIDRRVTSYIEINILLESELCLYILEKVMKMGHQAFLDLEAMAFHDIFPIGPSPVDRGLCEDVFYYISM